MNLDDETRARIRAEEEERHRVRQELSAADTERRTLASKPNWLAGLLANIVICGLGFVLIQEYGWALFWFVLALGLGVTVSPIASALVIIASTWTWMGAYDRKYATAEERARKPNYTVEYILLGIIGAVLLLVYLIHQQAQ